MTFPMKVTSYADYQRVLEVADRFNTDRPEYPIYVTLVGHRIEEESSEETSAKGNWYLDVVSSSPARLQFFMDEVQRLEKDAKKLEKLLKLPSAPKPLALPPPISSTDSEIVVEEVIIKKPARKKKQSKKEISTSSAQAEAEEDPITSALIDIFNDTERSE